MRHLVCHRIAWLLLISASFLLAISCVSPSTVHVDSPAQTLSKGNILSENGDYLKAAQLYGAALEKYPNDKRILYNLCLTQAQSGDFSGSLSTINRLVDMYPENVRFLALKGGVLSLSGKEGEACPVWENILILDPMDTKTRLLLIHRYQVEGKLEEAWLHARELFSQKAFSEELFNLMASLEVATGRGDGLSWTLLAAKYAAKAENDGVDSGNSSEEKPDGIPGEPDRE